MAGLFLGQSPTKGDRCHYVQEFILTTRLVIKQRAHIIAVTEPVKQSCGGAD